METTSTHFDSRTPERVRAVLESLRHSRALCRVFYGDPATGKNWMDEHDVYGRVGRSTGSIKVPLLVHPRAYGAPAMMDHCIVAIRDASGWRYRHENFAPPILTIEASTTPGLVETVRHDGEIWAQFGKAGQAARWVKFMRGERLSR